MKKTNQTYKMSKPLKRVLALTKFKSKEHKAAFKTAMIDAEVTALRQPEKQSEQKK